MVNTSGSKDRRRHLVRSSRRLLATLVLTFFDTLDYIHCCHVHCAVHRSYNSVFVRSCDGKSSDHYHLRLVRGPALTRFVVLLAPVWLETTILNGQELFGHHWQVIKQRHGTEPALNWQAGKLYFNEQHGQWFGEISQATCGHSNCHDAWTDRWRNSKI